jgi:arylsulfatase
MPDKPFFVYYAPGATHAPHHVPKAWIEKYKGKFDQGWDKLREETFERQKKLGLIPGREAHQATRRDSVVGLDVCCEMKPILARQMEVYAPSCPTPT